MIVSAAVRLIRTEWKTCRGMNTVRSGSALVLVQLTLTFSADERLSDVSQEEMFTAFPGGTDR